MESYIRAIRIWLVTTQKIPVEETYGKVKNFVANRNADEVAQIAELANRLNKNQQLAAALELDSLACRRLLNAALVGKLNQMDLEELAESEAYVRLNLGILAADKLPKLQFREKK